MYYRRSGSKEGQSVNIKSINNNSHQPLAPCSICSSSTPTTRSTLTLLTLTMTVTGSSRGAGVLLEPADWLIVRQVEVELLVVPPVQSQEEDQEEEEGEDEGPGPDQAEHDWGEPWLEAGGGGVGVARPGSQVLRSLGGGEQSRVAAGVGAVAGSQATVTLLTLLHHRVATETGAPVVLLQ